MKKLAAKLKTKYGSKNQVLNDFIATQLNGPKMVTRDSHSVESVSKKSMGSSMSRT